MQPINKSERKKAFWHFLLLFVICIVIITTTIFFSIQVPFKQNNQLLRDKTISEREQDFSTRFMNQMSGITTMLDTINTKATRPDLVDYQINENIKKLSAMVAADSVYNQGLYVEIVRTLSDLSSAKKELREQLKKDFSATQLQSEKDILSRELEAVKNDNAQLRILLQQQRRP